MVVQNVPTVRNRSTPASQTSLASESSEGTGVSGSYFMSYSSMTLLMFGISTFLSKSLSRIRGPDSARSSVEIILHGGTGIYHHPLDLCIMDFFTFRKVFLDNIFKIRFKSSKNFLCDSWLFLVLPYGFLS